MTLKDVLDDVGSNIVKGAKRNLTRITTHGVRGKRYNSIASGRLYNSLKTTVTAKVGSNNNPLSYQLVFEMKDYGYWVDQGRKPGPISIAGTKNLKDWMRTKNINSKFLFVIKRNIEKNGYRATKFFEKAYNDEIPNIDKLIDEMLVETQIITS